MARTRFGLAGFVYRWIPALILVFITYNPLRWSYVHWVASTHLHDMLAIKVLAGLVLLIGYGVYLTATWKSIGPEGLIVLVIFFAVLLWVFYTLGWIRPSNPTEYAWIALIILATILAIGMSWSGIWRRLTGQVTTDVVEDEEHHD